MLSVTNCGLSVRLQKSTSHYRIPIFKFSVILCPKLEKKKEFSNTSEFKTLMVAIIISSGTGEMPKYIALEFPACFL